MTRMHDISAAGAGDLGIIPDGESIGPCPSCRAELRVCDTLNPRTGQIERAMQHPVPFCSYFGDTDAAEIERAVKESP